MGCALGYRARRWLVEASDCSDYGWTAMACKRVRAMVKAFAWLKPGTMISVCHACTGFAGQACERLSAFFVVEFRETRGLGSSRAVPRWPCLPRSGASMAHPVIPPSRHPLRLDLQRRGRADRERRVVLQERDEAMRRPVWVGRQLHIHLTPTRRLGDALQ